MKRFTDEKQTPGAATVNTDLIGFNVGHEDIEYAASIIMDNIRTTVYMETGGMVEEF